MWRPDPRNWRISKGPGRTQRNGKKWRGAGCLYLAQRKVSVFLIAVFPKNEKENLSMAERNALKKRADNIFETYGR
jgi:hypothetical protein